MACFRRESAKIIAFKGSSLALSASLCSAALPKGEPLAVPANFILLPEPLPFGAVDLRSTDRAENPPKAEKKRLPHSFCAAAPWSKMFWNTLRVRFGHYQRKNYCYKSKVGQPAGCPALLFYEKQVFPAVRSQYRSTPSLVTRAYTSGASSGFSAPYARPLRYSAAAASNLSAAP